MESIYIKIQKSEMKFNGSRIIIVNEIIIRFIIEKSPVIQR
jgi:hypothetical protein